MIPVWIVLVMASMFVLMGLYFQVQARDVTFVNLLGVTDYYKHLYVMASINNHGVHPFYPFSSFIYYFGYYFFPALVSATQILDQTKIIYIYSILTGVLGWLAISDLIIENVKPFKARLVSIMYLVFGQGLDIVPTLMVNKQGAGKLIELWSFEKLIGLRVDNIFTSYLWTPQHFFAAVAACVVILSVYKNKKEWLWSILLIAFVLSSSVFVGIFMMIALFGIVLIDRRLEIKKYLLIFTLSGLVLIPNLIAFAQKGSGVFEMYDLRSVIFNFGLGGFLNLLAHLLSEYGLVFLAIPIGVYLMLKKSKNRAWWILLGVAPVVITWFVKSVGYNDFSIRGVLVWQLLAGILLGVLFERSNLKMKFMLAILIIINLGVSGVGFAYEFEARRLDSNFRLGPEESILIGEIKNKKLNNLMAIGREEWIFLIPSMTGEVVLNSNLYDSAQYMDSKLGETHGQYESLENEIFFKEISGTDEESVLEQAEQRWAKMNGFFEIAGRRNLIVDRRNKSTLVLSQFDIDKTMISGDFSLFNTSDIISELQTKKIVLKSRTIDKISINDLVFVVKCIERCTGEILWAEELKSLTNNKNSNMKAYLYNIEIQ